MPLNPPLTLAQLDPIAVRKDQTDISALLWAIKRLPIQMLRGDQAQGGMAGGGGIIGDVLRGELDRERQACSVTSRFGPRPDVASIPGAILR
ncbi:hypothetical protein [Massilia violaceinigra]|nr:hypothetical protein [Massilia violaceinigra]